MPTLPAPSVVELCPSTDKPAKYFTEIFVTDIVKIPPQKPPKENVVNMSRTITLEDVETITVTLPNGVTGNKVFVAGNLYLGLQYSALRADQSVHYVRFQLPFQAIILADCGQLIPTTDPIFPNNYVVHICVEKITETQIDNRTILVEALFLVWLEQINP